MLEIYSWGAGFRISEMLRRHDVAAMVLDVLERPRVIPRADIRGNVQRDGLGKSRKRRSRVWRQPGVDPLHEADVGLVSDAAKDGAVELAAVSERLQATGLGKLVDEKLATQGLRGQQLQLCWWPELGVNVDLDGMAELHGRAVVKSDTFATVQPDSRVLRNARARETRFKTRWRRHGCNVNEIKCCGCWCCSFSRSSFWTCVFLFWLALKQLTHNSSFVVPKTMSHSRGPQVKWWVGWSQRLW